MFDALSDRFDGIFKRLRGRGRLSDKDIDEVAREIRVALLEADVNVAVVKSFINRVKERARGAEVAKSLSPAQQVIKIVHEELVTTLGGETGKLAMSSKPPTVLSDNGCRESTTPLPMRNDTTGAPIFSASARISGPASTAPPPIQIIGALAPSTSLASAAIFSGSGTGLSRWPSGSTGVTSAVAGNMSQGISTATGPGRPDVIAWKARAMTCGASVGCSMRSANFSSVFKVAS